jgi:uncharacterized membrane protein YgcG
VAPFADGKYVYDEISALKAPTRDALNEILAEHDRIAHQQITLAILPRLEGSRDLEKETTRLYTEWAVGAQEQARGLLVVWYWEDRKVRMVVGTGLKPFLNDNRVQWLTTEGFLPSLRASNADQAALDGFRLVLEHLESLVVANRFFERTLEKHYPGQEASDYGGVPVLLGELVAILALAIWVGRWALTGYAAWAPYSTSRASSSQ